MLSQNRQESPMETLPDEIITIIFLYARANWESFFCLSRVSNRFRTIANDVRADKLKKMEFHEKLHVCLLSSAERYLKHDFNNKQGTLKSMFSFRNNGPEGKERASTIQELAKSAKNNGIALLTLSMAALSVTRFGGKPTTYSEKFLFPLLTRGVGIIPPEMTTIEGLEILNKKLEEMCEYFYSKKDVSEASNNKTLVKSNIKENCRKLIEIMKEILKASYNDTKDELKDELKKSLLTYLNEITFENLMRGKSNLSKKINADYLKLQRPSLFQQLFSPSNGNGNLGGRGIGIR